MQNIYSSMASSRTKKGMFFPFGEPVLECSYSPTLQVDTMQLLLRQSTGKWQSETQSKSKPTVFSTVVFLRIWNTISRTAKELFISTITSQSEKSTSRRTDCSETSGMCNLTQLLLSMRTSSLLSRPKSTLSLGCSSTLRRIYLSGRYLRIDQTGECRSSKFYRTNLFSTLDRAKTASLILSSSEDWVFITTRLNLLTKVSFRSISSTKSTVTDNCTAVNPLSINRPICLPVALSDLCWWYSQVISEWYLKYYYISSLFTEDIIYDILF